MFSALKLVSAEAAFLKAVPNASGETSFGVGLHICPLESDAVWSIGGIALHGRDIRSNRTVNKNNLTRYCNNFLKKVCNNCNNCVTAWKHTPKFATINIALSQFEGGLLYHIKSILHVYFW